MKLILAIIRIAKMPETKHALEDVNLPSFSAMPVVGRGKGHGDLEKLKGLDPGAEEYISSIPRLKSKRMITLVVSDENKDLAVETLLKVNSTSKSGDGKIFVIDVSETVQIRTGATGDAALD